MQVKCEAPCAAEHSAVRTISHSAGPVQVKPEAPCAAVVWNILIDHARVEALVLCPDERTGATVLRSAEQRHNAAKIWCRDDRKGPVEMELKGATECIFPWSYAPPQALLSSVLPPPPPFALVATECILLWSQALGTFARRHLETDRV